MFAWLRAHEGNTAAAIQWYQRAAQDPSVKAEAEEAIQLLQANPAQQQK